MKKVQHLIKACIMALPILAFGSCQEIDDEYTGPAPVEVNWNEAAASLESTLIDTFWDTNRHVFNESTTSNGFQYWPQAHAMDIVIDAYDRTKDEKYIPYFSEWYEGIKSANGWRYYNDYNDDMAWIAITLTKLYQRTEDQKYLTTAVELWERIVSYWNTDYLDGGVAWHKDQPWAKNACINGPASFLSMQLYSITKDEKYLNWAEKIYLWTKGHLFNTSTGAVYDGFDGRENVLDKTALTYNQALFMASGLRLYKAKNNMSYLMDARRTAVYTISSNETLDLGNNILRHEGDGDGALFKGIFMRYLVEMIEEDALSESYRTTFKNFMIHNAQVAWKGVKDNNPTFFSPGWDKAAGENTSCNAQVAGTTLIEAVCKVTK